MRLSPQNIERFYRIWFALLHYVNAQVQLVPDFPEIPGKEAVSTDVTVQLRDALLLTILHSCLQKTSPSSRVGSIALLIPSPLCVPCKNTPFFCHTPCRLMPTVCLAS